MHLLLDLDVWMHGWMDTETDPTGSSSLANPDYTFSADFKSCNTGYKAVTLTGPDPVLRTLLMLTSLQTV